MTSGPDEYPHQDQAVDIDMVSRRIVMHRELWGKLVSLAESMTKQKGVLVTPNDVAVMAIEAGVARQSMATLAKHRKPRHGR